MDQNGMGKSLVSLILSLSAPFQLLITNSSHDRLNYLSGWKALLPMRVA
ncbi:hypothetical protein [Paenibacillus sp. BAC0078]